MTKRVLVVDDEVNMRWVLKEALTDAGYDVAVAGSGQEALSEMTHQPADLIILDLKMKGMDGLGTLARVRERWPEVVVIILTAYGTVTTAVEAMQLGAADYLRKPFDVEEVSFKIQRALERKALHSEVRHLRQTARTISAPAIVGTHPVWQRCLEQLTTLTSLDHDLVLYGDPGVGKTQLAHVAHSSSQRSEAPLIVIDCQIIRTNPALAAFFAPHDDQSVWSRAGDGAVLLHHAHVLPPEIWNTIGAVVHGRTNRPRLLCTAETSLQIPFTLAELHVPRLAEHASDIALIVRALDPENVITPAALRLLEQYAWPGNQTELRHVIERAAVLARGAPIEREHLPVSLQAHVPDDLPIHLPPEGINLEAVEISLIRQALVQAHGNKSRAAELLGLTRHTLLYRLDKYGVKTNDEPT